MLCYVMLCYVMLCYAMLCYAMLFYVILCYAKIKYILLYISCCFVLDYATSWCANKRTPGYWEAEKSDFTCAMLIQQIPQSRLLSLEPDINSDLPCWFILTTRHTSISMCQWLRGRCRCVYRRVHFTIPSRQGVNIMTSVGNLSQSPERVIGIYVLKITVYQPKLSLGF